MRARSATVAGVLSLATAANAVGNAIINNYCAHDVYLWPVSVDESPSSPTIIKANGGSWSQQYKTCSSGGWSLKLSNTADMSSGITQFEYTLEPGTIWYDISNVNCLPFGSGTCPFMAYGMFLQSGSGCPTASCAAGAATCHDAYTYPKDDWASLACQPSADTTLDLCSPSGGSVVSGIIGQVTSAVGNLLNGGAQAEAAPPSTSTPVSSPPASKPSSAAADAGPGSASNNKGAVGIAAVQTSSSTSSAAPAPSPSTSTSSPPPPPPPPPSSTSTPQTTLVTVAATTPAPAKPNVAIVYETVTEMVATTTVVYQHKMAHKAKRDTAHPHARRHQHES